MPRVHRLKDPETRRRLLELTCAGASADVITEALELHPRTIARYLEVDKSFAVALKRASEIGTGRRGWIAVDVLMRMAEPKPEPTPARDARPAVDVSLPETGTTETQSPSEPPAADTTAGEVEPDVQPDEPGKVAGEARTEDAAEPVTETPVAPQGVVDEPPDTAHRSEPGGGRVARRRERAPAHTVAKDRQPADRHSDIADDLSDVLADVSLDRPSAEGFMAIAWARFKRGGRGAKEYGKMLAPVLLRPLVHEIDRQARADADAALDRETGGGMLVLEVPRNAARPHVGRGPVLDVEFSESD